MKKLIDTTKLIKDDIIRILTENGWVEVKENEYSKVKGNEYNKGITFTHYVTDRDTTISLLLNGDIIKRINFNRNVEEFNDPLVQLFITT